MESWSDPELGLIHIVRNPKAKRIIMRPEQNGIRVTCSPYTPLSEAKSVIERFRERLKTNQKKMEERTHFIDLNFRIDTDVMQLQLTEGDKDGFYVNRRQGECTIICPKGTDFAKIQDWLRNVIIDQLRVQAKVHLYNTTIDIARKYGFKFSSIKIQSSRTRWGSCSGTNAINLSLYLMTLPSHLIDYVIKHELCHTVEHNHGERFWALMDKVTGNKAHELRTELLRHITSI